MTVDPRANSSIILVTNTQVVSGRCPRVSFTKALFKMGRVCPDAICRTHCMGRYLSGSSEVMSGLTVVTDTLVLMIVTCFLSSVPWLQTVMTVLFWHSECITRRYE